MSTDAPVKMKRYTHACQYRTVPAPTNSRRPITTARIASASHALALSFFMAPPARSSQVGWFAHCRRRARSLRHVDELEPRRTADETAENARRAFEQRGAGARATATRTSLRRHGGNAIVVARIGYLRSRPSSMLSSISASVIGDNSPRVWALLISLESTCQDGSSTFE